MRSYFGVRRQRRRISSPRVSKGSILEQALPHGRASDTFHFTRIARSALVLIYVSICFQPIGSLAQRRATATITIDTSHPTNRIVPSRALGAGVDGHSEGETAQQLSPQNVEEMLSAGLKPLSYRLRTELAGEAWHWNPQGKWSEANKRQGYWTSNSKLGPPIQVSFGYRLPRRGNTIDQANDDGYSRIDDGDPKTFWKSNPYLDEHFTGANDPASPQWVMIDLGARKKINAARIFWAEPYATSFTIEYGDFVGPEDLSQRLPTDWHPFPRGEITGATGGDRPIRLSSSFQVTRYVRIQLNQSSETGPVKSADIRDRLGFAIREIQLGAIDSQGRFNDVMRHAPTKNGQTVIYVSSTDPWHREIDRDPETEQPGLDFIFKSGLTNGLPMLVPVPVLFDTPENSAALIRYLQARRFPLERVEMGEEPDGQFVNPEHYGALYLQFEKAIHKVNPALQLGGPSMQDIEQTQVPGRIEFGKAGWVGGFLKYLQRQGQLDKFKFFSFEWYPFGDDCKPQQLAESTQMLSDALNELQQGGLTHDIPWLITEYGYSAFGARAEVDIDGALLNADSVGRFLTLGGETAYLYGYEASQVIKEQECSSGNNMLFFRDDNGRIKKPTAAYWGARLMTQQWVQPGDQLHEIYEASSDVRNGNHDQVVTAYAVHRPDGQWALMLINRDFKRPFATNVVFRNASRHTTASFDGPVDLFQYSRSQYQLNADPKNPFPITADPPEHRLLEMIDSKSIELPPTSLTIVRGHLPADWAALGSRP